ncbi:MAG: hypothetical protein J1E34_05120 [Oscillospiraceae bacterium]|nr:hypothetical protein [Oscillospiraceae bacterium]
MDGSEWWNCPPDGNPTADESTPKWKRLAKASGDEQSPGVGDYSGNAILAMATASYWKDRINEHYAEQYEAKGGKLDPDTGKGAILNDQTTCELYTIGVDMAPNMTLNDPNLRSDVLRSNDYSGIEPEEMLRYINGGRDGDIVELTMDPHYALLPLEEKQALWDSDENVRLNWPNRPTTDNIFREEVLEFWDAYQSGEDAPVEQGRVFFWMSLSLSMGGLPMSIQRIVPSTGLGANGPGTNIKGEVVTDEKYKQELKPEYVTNEKGEITGFTPEFQEVLKDYQLNGYMPSYKEPTHMSHPPKDKDITTLEYSDGFINIDSCDNVRNLESALSDILIKFINDSMVGPTAGQNTLSGMTEDVVTYKDPIGRYMEIKNIDSFVMFGQQYHLEKDGAPDPVSGRQYYKIVDKDLKKIELEPSAYKRGHYFNPCYDYKLPEDLEPYERVDFRPTDIKIWVDSVDRVVGSEGVEEGLETYGGFEQVLYVEIPSNALPLRTVIIEEDISDPYNKIMTYRTNAGDDKDAAVDEYGKSQKAYYAESTPFRLFYSVGLASTLLDPTKEKPTVADNVADIVDKDYLGTVYETTGTLFFFSNWYSEVNDEGNEKKYTYSSGETYTFGDPVMSFSPNKGNRYYIFQENLWLYKSADENVDSNRDTHIVEGGYVTGEEGSWKWNDNGVSIGTPITDKETQVIRDQIYYDVVTWFENIDGKAQEIHYALPRRGQGFSSSLGDKNDDTMYNDYLHYINKNDPTDVVDSDIAPGSNYVVAVKKGALRVGNMATSVRAKNIHEEPRGNLVVSADERTVTWTFEAEPGEEGVIELTVKVKANAQDGDIIGNKVSIQFGSDDPKYAIQTNPISSTSTAVDPGRGIPVKQGSEFTYKINWKNTKLEATQITITDILDSNVEYIEASDSYTVYAPNHTGTASTFYMPTVGSNSNGEEGYNSKLNLYLGNNGRMAVIVPEKEVIAPPNASDGDDFIEDGDLVDVGDEIYYKIWWQNTEEPAPTDATVTITDPLDAGVDFLEASYGDGINGLVKLQVTDSEAAKGGVYNETGIVTSNEEVTISYDKATHTVKWTIEKVAQYAYGYVLLKVKVNENARKAWGYDLDENDNLIGKPGNGNDYRVLNRAGVQVNNKPERRTNTTVNPLDPNKTETNIKRNEDGADETVTANDNLKVKPDTPEDANTTWEGPTVFVDDIITYEINWANNLRDENGKGKNATVVITDPLDENVTFEEASYQNVTLTADNKLNLITGKVGKITVTISYDKETHTVKWILNNIPYATIDIVTLKVKVAGGATQVGKVDNQANIQIGNEYEIDTDIVENPTPKPKKENDKEYELPLKPGDKVGYKVSWENYQEEDAEVVITDKLDEDVEFVSAEFGDISITQENPTVTQDGITISYDETTHTITWNLGTRESGDNGEVTLTVLVLDSALTNDVENTADVKVGNDPKVKTNPVDNPVFDPEKKEISPGEGLEVNTGDEIEYSITWKNYKREKATVTITDPLDKNVAFKEASYNGVTLTAAEDGSSVTVSDKKDEPDIIISYDKDTHTVTWVLHKQESFASGDVNLTVEVLASASNRVKNGASVQVGNDPKVDTNIVENPVPRIALPEAGGIGAKLLYQISAIILLFAATLILCSKMYSYRRKRKI